MLVRNLLLVLGGLTLVAGLVLAILWVRMPSAPRGEESANQPAAILVAATDLPAGVILRGSDIKWMAVDPSAIAPDNLVRGQVSETSYVGALTRSHFSADEPLRTGDILRANERGFLAAALSPGMQAVSLAVDGPQSVSGLAQPGDRVDVVLLEPLGEASAAGTTSAVSATVLQNARIVAVDQWFNDSTKPAKTQAVNFEARVPRTITLELSALDAKRLLVASQLGRLTLTLRSLAGAPSVPITVWPQPVWSSEVSAQSSVRSERKGEAPSRTAIVIMRGAKTETP